MGFREQLWVGLRWTFCLGAAWWLSEVCNLITAYHHLDGLTLGTAAVILWGLLIAFAVPIGALHGLARYFAGRRDEVPWYRGLYQWLTDGLPDTQHRRSASLLALVGAAIIVFSPSYYLARLIIREVVRQKFQAYLILMVVAGLAVLAAWLFPWMRGVAYQLIRRASALPALGLVVRRSRNLAVVLSSAAGLFLGWLVHKYWGDLFSHVPWAPILVIVGAVFLSIFFWEIWRRVRRWPRLASTLGAVMALVTMASLVYGTVLSPYEWTARRLAFHDARSGRVMDRVLKAYFDFDRDGYLSIFGGGDCGPHEASIHPGAIDTPSNGLDEDCSGDDLTPDAFLSGGQEDYPLSSRVPSRPNVVFITIDAWAARHSALLGYDRTTTPNLDRFAEESAFFEACFAQGPSTRLSFPSLFTSRWDSQLPRVNSPRMPRSLEADQHQIQDLFKEAGYATAAVISEGYFTRRRWGSMVRDFDELDESPATAGTHTAPQVTEAALRILNEEREEPIFLWVHYYDAHSPYQAIEDFEAFGTTQRDLYDTELRYLDQEILPLLDAVRERGDTLTVITSDHGTVFHPQPRTRRARYGFDLYTATLHVPLIVHAGFIEPSRFDHPVSTMDVLPTFSNVLRSEEAHDYEGYSLVPEIFDGRPNRPDAVFAQFFLPERAMRDREPLQKVALRTGDFNLVFSRDTGAYELYNWREDYFEMEDLAEEGNRDLTMLRSVLGAYVLAMTGEGETEEEPEVDPADAGVADAGAGDATLTGDAGSMDGDVPAPNRADTVRPEMIRGRLDVMRSPVGRSQGAAFELPSEAIPNRPEAEAEVPQ